MLSFSLAQSQPLVEPDSIRYLSGNGSDSLWMDLYLPDQIQSPGWGMVFLHGGGFSAGARNDEVVQSFCQSMARDGVAIASVDYRLRQVGAGFHCDVSIADKQSAIRWAAEDLAQAIEVLKPEFPEGIIVCGTSAGAEAALFAGFHMEVPGIDGIISLAGAMEPGAGVDLPLLAFHGTCDDLVPFCAATHHYCPEGTPGALWLLGSGALANTLPQMELFVLEGAGHEISSFLLNQPIFMEAAVAFMEHVKSRTFQSQSHQITFPASCDSLSMLPFPCP